ncbi:DUF938 domain-containing protein [Pseudopelagicola sp. nBUS_19]|uniref:DUF938 domain-containing protein n=1 Tax=Pseudopelagicola sp. nBUS_19 TaxID=3395316 RepID=UPI003EC13997
MPLRVNLPKSASVAKLTEDGKLFSSSAARNVQAIVSLVRQRAPMRGNALELASGTGQHIVELARATPGLNWQPTEIDSHRRESINAHVAHTGLSNIALAMELDATAPGWSTKNNEQDFILLANLLHLISETETKTLIREASLALAPGGQLIIYGPFKRNNNLTSEGDLTFHTSLQATDSEIGYKNNEDVFVWGKEKGLTSSIQIDMPANNLAICWRKPH